MFENELFLDILLDQEIKRRIKFEGPHHSNQSIITEIDGTKYKIRDNGKRWDIKNPCVICSDEECIEQINKLTNKYDNTISICKNPLNNNLLRMLCNWRKHIKETFIEEQKYGSDKWKKTHICTSELTFLGRKTELGGIIGGLSMTDKHIYSIPLLASLTNDGIKGLSAGFIILIGMYMEWDLYTIDNQLLIKKLLKKTKDIYLGTPWSYMFECILERKRIPDKLKEIILSRAHLP